MILTDRGIRRFLLLTVTLAAVFSVLFIYVYNTDAGTAGETDSINFVFFNVGQGDASLIETGAGVCLIDSGPESAQDELVNALRARNVSAIQFFFVTHLDSDHSGGADAVIRNFDVEAVYLPASVSSCTALDEIRQAAAGGDTDIRLCMEGDVFMLGNTEIKVLSPSFPFAGDENSDSLVLLASYGLTRALFMADADTAAEERLIETYAPSALSENTDSFYKEGTGDDYDSAGLFCDILKVGHHGSETSTSEAFLSAVRPVYAVISCGRANSYGHPSPLILHRLKNIGAQILRTDLSGNIILTSDGINVKYKQ